MDCTQKNAAHRSPRVTGVTRWTLEAGYKIMSPAASFTGNFLIDDTFLATQGVTDFDHYRVDPAAPLVADFFVPDDIPPPPGVRLG